MGNGCDVARWSPGACLDRRALAQCALVCELSGELELAVALIRRMQRPSLDTGDSLATPRMPGRA